MKRSLLRATLPVLLALASLGAQAAPYSSNLIVAGDAESGTSAWAAFAGVPLFETTAYASPLFLYPDAEHGSSHFKGSSASLSAGWQQVDVNDNAGAIDAGRVAFNLDAYLGGVGDQEDNTLLYVSFLDAVGNEVDHTELGPNYLDLRAGLTVLGGFHTSGWVPEGTRSILFSLSMEGWDGDSGGAYADNLSFTLSQTVPEPQSLALALFSLLAMGSALRGRAR